MIIYITHQHNIKTIIYFYRRNILKALVFKSWNEPSLLVPFLPQCCQNECVKFFICLQITVQSPCVRLKPGAVPSSAGSTLLPDSGEWEAQKRARFKTSLPETISFLFCTCYLTNSNWHSATSKAQSEHFSKEEFEIEVEALGRE